MMYDNLYANSDTQKLKTKKTEGTKNPILWLSGGHKLLKYSEFMVTIMSYHPCDNLHANSDTQELKLQRISIQKPYFMNLRWP